MLCLYDLELPSNLARHIAHHKKGHVHIADVVYSCIIMVNDIATNATIFQCLAMMHAKRYQRSYRAILTYKKALFVFKNKKRIMKNLSLSLHIHRKPAKYSME